MPRTARHATTLFGRAALLRCPHCGGRSIFTSWFRARAHCPTCGLALERGEEGYRVGSYMFNVIASELLFAALLAGVVAWTWPTPPWTLLQFGAPALMIVMPLAMYPFSKTLFLAFDLFFHPLERHERLAPPDGEAPTHQR